MMDNMLFVIIIAFIIFFILICLAIFYDCSDGNGCSKPKEDNNVLLPQFNPATKTTTLMPL